MSEVPLYSPSIHGFLVHKKPRLSPPPPQFLEFSTACRKCVEGLGWNASRPSTQEALVPMNVKGWRRPPLSSEYGTCKTDRARFWP